MAQGFLLGQSGSVGELVQLYKTGTGTYTINDDYDIVLVISAAMTYTSNGMSLSYSYKGSGTQEVKNIETYSDRGKFGILRVADVKKGDTITISGGR